MAQPVVSSHLADHSYHHESMEKHLDKVQEELRKTKKVLETKSKKLKIVKQKVRRREAKIENLLTELERNQVLQKEEVELLSYNFDRRT